ncbi:MAG TPA: SH3 domain-containing protein [Anaerolineae bacterium]|nr:SH3 domain-containing protein [Anaerolineae bacterium]
MMRGTRTLILILATLLPGCARLATPLAPASLRAVATVALAVTATPRPAPTATVAVAIAGMATATAVLTPTPSVTATQLPTRAPSPASPTATATPETPTVTLRTNANLRAGPGTAYPVIGGGKTGQTLVVTGRANGSVDSRLVTWWRTSQGWVTGSLVTANAAAQTVPFVTDVPPPPASEVKAEAKVEVVLTSTLTSTSPLPDLVVLGPDTQYPVRARVVRGWDYEFVDLSTQYDIVLYRDVFGLLAHQIDDANVTQHNQPRRFGVAGPKRITLIDFQPHPDAQCAGWGWAPERDTFVDPLGMNQEPCLVEHSLWPNGDGLGALITAGWGYAAQTTLAVAAGGPTLDELSTTMFADRLPQPYSQYVQPADYSRPLYQALGQAMWMGTRWSWVDPFVQIVPARP